MTKSLCRLTDLIGLGGNFTSEREVSSGISSKPNVDGKAV